MTVANVRKIDCFSHIGEIGLEEGVMVCGFPPFRERDSHLRPIETLFKVESVAFSSHVRKGPRMHRLQLFFPGNYTVIHRIIQIILQRTSYAHRLLIYVQELRDFDVHAHENIGSHSVNGNSAHLNSRIADQTTIQNWIICAFGPLIVLPIGCSP